ncbi:unnamed protein product [Urochloa decumbens]|uniref:F-box domain-containing protein n=1 Tax=Urochloa decumbens TaxID=240449 RepID=A0ABC8W705_9POAL
MVVLTEKLVEEILLRVPPDEPARLIRAALVCKAWSRILSGAGFRRRYRRLHPTPPLLGYINNLEFHAGLELVPTTSYFFPPPLPATNYRRALDCRHGRVLIQDDDDTGGGFVIWDPIAGSRQHLSFPTHRRHNLLGSFTGAVLCAVDGCDHLDCHGGPFRVVFVGTARTHTAAFKKRLRYTWASVYSSETGAWSARTSRTKKNYHEVWPREPSLLIGDALYFPLACYPMRILKYDLSAHRLSVITIQVDHEFDRAVPIDIDGRLGIVEYHRNCIYTWSRQADVNGVQGWARHNVAELETSIPTRRRSPYRDHPDEVIRFAEGTDTVLFSLHNYIDWGVFTLDLKSRQVRKVSDRWDCEILPYVSFCTPDLAKNKLCHCDEDARIRPS